MLGLVCRPIPPGNDGVQGGVLIMADVGGAFEIIDLGHGAIFAVAVLRMATDRMRTRRVFHDTLRLRRYQASGEAAGHDVLWPGGLFAAGEKVTARQIMEADRDALLSCDAVAALPDGAQVDDGTAWETGYACAEGITVLGLRTDLRLCAGSDGGLVNAMIQGSVVSMCRSTDDVLGVLGTLPNGTGKA